MITNVNGDQCNLWNCLKDDANATGKCVAFFLWGEKLQEFAVSLAAHGNCGKGERKPLPIEEVLFFRGKTLWLAFIIVYYWYLEVMLYLACLCGVINRMYKF